MLNPTEREQVDALLAPMAQAVGGSGVVAILANVQAVVTSKDARNLTLTRKPSGDIEWGYTEGGILKV